MAMTSETHTLAATAGHAPAPAGRIVKSLNHNWFFKRCDDLATDVPPAAGNGAPAFPAAQWESVNVPHTVRLEPLNASGGRNFQGVCWYGRFLSADPAWAGRTVYLHFEGAMQVCDVWLNGRKLGRHHGGYTPFVLDVTDMLRPGDANLLVLRLDNNDNPDVPPGKPQAELDFVYFGGLYRNVRLEIVHPLHVSDPVHANCVGGGGVFVTYPLVSPERAEVRVRTDLRNAGVEPRSCLLRQELFDPSGSLVASASDDLDVAVDATCDQTLVVERPALWHPDHPHLYTLRTSVVEGCETVDCVDTRLGIRRIEFSAADGLAINGAKFVSIGANRHQDHPYVGYALSDAAQWRDARHLREAGFTSFRSHYPQSPAFMDACDALGILAIVANPGWQFVGGDLFQQRALHNARLMVRRDRNHPSVLVWEAALNESDNRALAGALHSAIHEEYPGDQCFTAGDRNAHFAGPDDKGADVPSAWDIDYLHNDGTKPYWVREWGDAVDNWSDQQSANRVARGWGEWPMLTQTRAHLFRLDELRDAHHGTKTDDGRRLAGACLWAGIDCQRGYHHQPFYGGPIDAFRLPKFDFYLFQSQRPPTGPTGGPMVFIANFATFLSPKTVTVFSNCEQVRLVHGGRVVEVRTPDSGHRVAHPPFTFTVEQFSGEQSTMYMTGMGGPGSAPLELLAEGLIDGAVVASHVVRPPGVARKLAIEVDFSGHSLVADGVDFVRVHARVCDQHGTLCPFADDEVRFDTHGEGVIIHAPGANPVRADAGIATALVRATTVPGRVHVRAEAFGLEPAEVELDSVPDVRGAAATG
jgi:beta-galactosidase